jgi:hypothetical protein
MEQLLREADVADGDVRSIATRTTENGQGPWMIDIVSESGTVSMDTWALRSRINEAAAAILPNLLPAKRPDGVDYPNTILSPEFSIRREVRVSRVGGDALAIALPYYVVDGAGWGHLIGMSQFGAQAMAEAGSVYPEILAHYYGGLTPVPGDQFLPEQLAVGLVVGSEFVRIWSDSPLNVVVDGVPVGTTETGSWGFLSVDGVLQVIQPVRYFPWSGPEEF